MGSSRSIVEEQAKKFVTSGSEDMAGSRSDNSEILVGESTIILQTGSLEIWCKSMKFMRGSKSLRFKKNRVQGKIIQRIVQAAVQHPRGTVERDTSRHSRVCRFIPWS